MSFWMSFSMWMLLTNAVDTPDRLCLHIEIGRGFHQDDEMTTVV
jgi:hypothetical protein